LPNVVDIRNTGLVGAVHLASRENSPGSRGYEVFERCFREGLLVRCTGDIIALSPPLIIEPSHMDRIIDTLGSVIQRTPSLPPAGRRPAISPETAGPPPAAAASARARATAPTALKPCSAPPAPAPTPPGMPSRAGTT